MSVCVCRFADLKRGLEAVTNSEWENLPEVGNLTQKKLKRNPRFERDYAMPDSVTLGNLASSKAVGQLSEADMVSLIPLLVLAARLSMSINGKKLIKLHRFYNVERRRHACELGHDDGSGRDR
jgi:hypothetical protein